ncbi:MAG: M12 family metallo-peptidase [Phycisphaerales bacterium]
MLTTLALLAVAALPPSHARVAAPITALTSRIASLQADTGTRPLDPSFLAALDASDAPIVPLTLPDGSTLTLALERVDSVADGATFVSATRTSRGVVERPIATDMRCFVGRVDGRTDARVFVAKGAGVVGGFITLKDGAEERTLWLSNGRHGHGATPVVFDPSRAGATWLPKGGDFCHADELAQPARHAPRASGGVAGAGTPCREVLVALDTDVEYTANLFGGDQSAALAYAIALTAATSEIYTNDLNARLRVKYVRLWTGDDPWTMTNTVDQLFQYRDYWEANEGSVVRDLGHFLSGRGLGGGVAWFPALCSGGYAYGLSANLGGYFPYPLVDHDGANWDIMVYAHEIGHNFGAPHTHDLNFYNPPLDGCGNGDCSAAWTGTIMSYCHTCPGGMTNISLHFHPGNVATMLDFLATATCIPTDGGTAVAEDDYVVAGAGASTSVDFLFNDARVNCESVALESFDATTAHGAAVTLVPAPPGGRPTFSVAIPSNATDDDSFNYTIVDAANQTASATVHLNVLPLSPATVVNGAVAGVHVNYFAIGELDVLPDFTALSPYATDVLADVNIPSTGGNFATSGRPDLIGAVFEGWVNVSTSGFWTFFSESDDGSKLFVDGQLVVANDGLHGMVEKSGVIGLLPGRHAVRVEFFERYGGAGEIVRLQGPGLPKQVLPAAMWSHGGSIGPDLDGDGHVNGADLAILLGAWGTAGPTGDLNLDGVIDAADLGILLGGWTG